MARIILNTKGVRSQESRTVTPGVYTAKIITIIKDKPVSVTKQGEESVLPIPFEIQGGEFDKEWVWHRLPLTGDFRWVTTKFLEAVGIEVSADSEQGAIFNTDDLNNRKIRIEVVNNPDKNDPNKVYNNIKSFLPAKYAGDGGGIGF